MTPSSRRSFTYAVHPTSRGMGWVVFEGAFAPFDWGIVKAKGADKNDQCLRRIDEMLTRFAPETFVLEAFEAPEAARSERVVRLCRAITCLAADRGVAMVVYPRSAIRSCFSQVGARSRDEIAAAVVRHIDAFRHRLPRPRRAWESEDPRMALFSAAAVVLTHHQLGATSLFEGLNGATDGAA